MWRIYFVVLVYGLVGLPFPNTHSWVPGIEPEPLRPKSGEMQLRTPDLEPRHIDEIEAKGNADPKVAGYAQTYKAQARLNSPKSAAPIAASPSAEKPRIGNANSQASTIQAAKPKASKTAAPANPLPAKPSQRTPIASAPRTPLGKAPSTPLPGEKSISQANPLLENTAPASDPAPPAGASAYTADTAPVEQAPAQSPPAAPRARWTANTPRQEAPISSAKPSADPAISPSAPSAEQGKPLNAEETEPLAAFVEVLVLKPIGTPESAENEPVQPQGPAEKLASNQESVAMIAFHGIAAPTGGQSYSALKLPLSQTLHLLMREHLAERSDVVFVVDHTSSMNNDILQLRRDIKSTIAMLSTHPDVHVGMASYSDVKNAGEYGYRMQDLSTDYMAASRFLDETMLIGSVEDIYGAIFATAERFSWREGSKRMIIVLGDEPPAETPESNYSADEVVAICKAAGIKANVYPILIPKR